MSSSISRKPSPSGLSQPSSTRLRGKVPPVRRPWYREPVLVGGVVLPLAMILLLLAGLGWRSYRERAQVKKVEKMQAELFGEASKDLSWEDRRQKFQELRKETEKLPPQTREQLMMGGRRGQSMREEVKHFFELSPQEQLAHLDQKIMEWETRRQQWGGWGGNGGARGGAGRGRGGAGGGAGGGGGQGGAGAAGGGVGGAGGGPGGRGQGGAGGPGANAGNGSSANGGNNGGGNNGGGRGPGTGNDRQTRMKNRIDATTPEERVQFTTYFQMMQTRRTQLGIPGGPPFGR